MRSDVMGRMADLPVRVPQAVRNRLKVAAAKRGERLEDLVGGLVEQFLTEIEPKPPKLTDMLQRLRSIREALQSRGVASLWVSASIARGDARPDSDVDVTIELAPDATPSLLEIGHIKDEVEAALGSSRGPRKALDNDVQSGGLGRTRHGSSVLMPRSPEERLQDIHDAATDLRETMRP